MHDYDDHDVNDYDDDDEKLYQASVLLFPPTPSPLSALEAFALKPIMMMKVADDDHHHHNHCHHQCPLLILQTTIHLIFKPGIGRPGIGMPPSPGTGIWDHKEDDHGHDQDNDDDANKDDGHDNEEYQPPLDEPPSDPAQPWLG